MNNVVTLPRSNVQTVAIELRGVWYRVNGRNILREVDLTVERGTTTAIMGLSGSGKTTTLRLMMGLVRPTQGRVFVNGQDITGLNENDLNQIRKRMGLVFQYGALFDSLTVWENVAFGLLRERWLSHAEIDRIVKEKLEAVGLGQPGVERLLPAELSGGMKKRVSLARALAFNPDIILYDEPTTGLDPITTNVVNDLIVRMRDRFNVTSVVVSHDVESMFRIADRIVMIHEGKVIIVGTPDEIRNTTDPIVRQFIHGDTEGPITV
ncbi:MAG: ABC transporter ATP-binding protein [Abditibacteriales bacterium]|nr:ABC transporter ATP-binding protein [Abditibacteriales bacterium]MDW8366362.1 ABC transporter ATP-binding protein [Abditibacteriales bacterium]